MKKIVICILTVLAVGRDVWADQAADLVDQGQQAFQAGRFTPAMGYFKQAWERGNASADKAEFEAASLAMAELARMNSRIGRLEELKGNISQLKGRRLRGLAARYFEAASNAAGQMTYVPGESFKCGPYALDRILDSTDGDGKHSMPKLLHEAQSPKTGFSLKQVQAFSKKLGMGLRAAKRSPGAEVVIPCVVHWKLGHYAALTQKKGEKYLSEDPTFATKIFPTQEILDEEASGYFLIPENRLPPGWIWISDLEAAKIHGKGFVGDPLFLPPFWWLLLTGDLSCATGMPNYAFDAASAMHVLRDVPLRYQTPKGPEMRFELTYHPKDEGYDKVGASNFGPGWSFNWGSYIDSFQGEAGGMTLVSRGGGSSVVTGVDRYDQASFLFSGYQQMHGWEGYTGLGGYCLDTMVNGFTIVTRDLPDGSSDRYEWAGEITFGQSSPLDALDAEFCGAITRFYLKKTSDPAGNITQILYDAQNRIVGIRDTLGQQSQFQYGNVAFPNSITRITDPFGRYANFEYDIEGRLSAITDQVGLRTEFKHEHQDLADVITSMHTPYGKTTFDMRLSDVECGNGAQRCTDVVDAVGNRERVEFNQSAAVPSGPAPGGMAANDSYLQFRNSLHWGKKAMQDSPGIAAAATIYHWLHEYNPAGGPSPQSYMLESMQAPGKGRVWFNWIDQPGTLGYHYTLPTGRPWPVAIGRVVEHEIAGSHDSIQRFEYNSLGRVTRFTDAKGRVFNLEYAPNNFDLIAVKDANNVLLMAQTYNLQHKPLTRTDAAGQVTRYEYNAVGQLKKVIAPLGDVTRLTYDSQGYLILIEPPQPGRQASMGYDTFGRLASTTDAVNGTIRYAWDNLDRRRRVDYADGSFEEAIYDRLDMQSSRDRNGRVTHFSFDAGRRLTSVIDPKGQITGFEWCGCGSLEALIDPSGNRINWDYDVAGRMTQKTYADGSQFDYTYQTLSGELSTRMDPKGNLTRYRYFNDGRLANVRYTVTTATDAANKTAATPDVSFTYDTLLGRLSSMLDGTGSTSFEYHPHSVGQLGAGRIKKTDGPLVNDSIEYDYDANGRMTSRSIGGVAETYDFTPGKSQLAKVTNALGEFDYVYDNAGRLDNVAYPNGQHAAYQYFGPNNDGRLKQIKNSAPGGAVLSQFDYEYNPAGEITKWTQLQNGGSKIWDMTAADAYDGAGQLHKATLQATSGNTAHQWDYDPSGNRIAETIGGVTASTPANNLNQLTMLSQTQATVQGDLNRAATVTVNGSPASVNAGNEFEAQVPLPATDNTVEIQATASDGAVTTNRYNVKKDQPLTYDANGNMISDGSRTFEWDAENRLVKVTNSQTSPATITEMAYDGEGRRRHIVVKQGATVISDRQYVFDKAKKVEERDGVSGQTLTKYFEHGEQKLNSGDAGNYFYATDHLDSVRSITDQSGAVRASYDFDLWGKRSKISGDIDTQVGYTRHFEESGSGLVLTWFRAYEPSIGRWLSRDPVGEEDNLNLYAYVSNNPVNAYDPFGLMGCRPDKDRTNPPKDPTPSSNPCLDKYRGDIKHCQDSSEKARTECMKPPLVVGYGQCMVGAALLHTQCIKNAENAYGICKGDGN